MKYYCRERGFQLAGYKLAINSAGINLPVEDFKQWPDLYYHTSFLHSFNRLSSGTSTKFFSSVCNTESFMRGNHVHKISISR